MRTPPFESRSDDDAETGRGVRRRTFLRSSLAMGVAGALAGQAGTAAAQSGAASTSPAAPSSAGPAANAKGLLGHRVYGAGKEVILVLHEWMGTQSNYDFVLPFLDQDSFTYVFADLRGYGLSRALLTHADGTPNSYTAAEIHADVMALMAGLGVKRFHLLGHSMTGLIAQYIALKEYKGPGVESPIKSILCVTPVRSKGWKGPRAGLDLSVTDDAEMRKAIRARVAGKNGKENAVKYSETWVTWKLERTRRECPTGPMKGYLDMFCNTDIEAELNAAKPRIPVLLFVGTDDVGYYQHDDIIGAFTTPFGQPGTPGSTLTVADDGVFLMSDRRPDGTALPKPEIVSWKGVFNTGHYPMLAAPALFIAKIEEFVKAHA
ncbi:alpha/beta hydrolase [Azospirillum sp. SYSU D00513]|uniref:alpha/beta fold hydrolase n=1 Tax=Azospirillum sp. SYSU D00513 TaxID=2812561 RepID=UPI001A967345|nr:alpha/beta hydrolase [Azospirillum sp. SYSU D00513]